MTEEIICRSCLNEKPQSDFRRQRKLRKDGTYGFARCCKRCEAGMTELHEVRRISPEKPADLELPDIFWRSRNK